MRTIDVSEVTWLVRRLCMEANYYLPADLRQAFVRGQKAEQSPLGKEIFGEMLANCDLARRNDVPVCQDTGMAIVFAEVGQEVHLTGGAFEDAVTEGVRRGYIDGYLRLSVVGDPLRRENTNDNTPCVLYTSIVAGDKIKITVAPKGFGSENMSAMKMFTPAATREQIVDFIADACIRAGSNPCPPIVIGVGLGGTSDKAAYLAKRALLRPVDRRNEDPMYAEMERAVLDKVNASGVGPQGLGGTVTALSCAIEPFGTHIAGLPCVVNISCHVTRHAEGEL
ncbi:fumarate hydratase [Agathobaculum sp. NSJ-28]|uniref:Fumarate hydratase n=2 Tax=Agathobaculum TaxID=2048137 RepID=A0A923LWG5_9FIRM|nr:MULTISPECIES: fumarate hydratase [Agathobaculum]MBC5725958.1 fumarate hydratase [Agathobaculum faecis]MBS6882296.1 fumarate hydratase [Clostridiaceae bacterium]MCU6789181.1 fumarate hydratase [Agathobaculum ammoniilyticum]SCJ08179.1 L(+)-tartrate dehydratase subunit alpha [uncultured Butyricicoccus sp.]